MKTIYKKESERSLKANEMKIGDVVKLANVTSAYSHSTVIKIDKENNLITLFRPYVHLADFTYTGGVIPYVGTEKHEIWMNSPCEYILIENIFRPSQAEIDSSWKTWEAGLAQKRPEIGSEISFQPKKLCECSGRFHLATCALRKS